MASMTGEEARSEARERRAEGVSLADECNQFLNVHVGRGYGRDGAAVVFILSELEKFNARLLDIEDELGIDSAPDSSRER